MKSEEELALIFENNLEQILDEMYNPDYQITRN